MGEATTLIEFIESAGGTARVYDMGRHITPLVREEMLAIERGETPYPSPLMAQAWLGLLIQRENDPEPIIWFLRFPLDEQGLLVPASRDVFLHDLVEQALTRKDSALQAGPPEDNPFSFIPRDDYLAVFHAKVSVDLGRPPSRYYDHARKYFSGDLGWDQWSFLGYQGIADLAARHHLDDNDTQLIAAIPHLPTQPCSALFQCLENENLAPALTDAVATRVRSELSHPRPQTGVIAHGLRGLSMSNPVIARTVVMEVLAVPAGRDPTVLAAISARMWTQVLDEEVRRAFLQSLAENTVGQDFFNQCLGELLFLPGMREPLLGSLRLPRRGEALSRAIGEFFRTVMSAGDPRNPQDK